MTACRVPKVIDKMFIRAAHVLSEKSPMHKDPTAKLFPEFEQLREISRAIAIAIGELAVEEKLIPALSHREITQRVDAKMWVPNYPQFRKKSS